MAKVDPNGNREWTTQVGTTAADRGYGLAIDPAGAIYAGGYIRARSAARSSATKT